MDAVQGIRVHFTLDLYQHWSPAVIRCNKKQSTMSMETGDESAATDTEATEPPIGVVAAPPMEVTEPPIGVVEETTAEETEPPVAVVDAVAIHRMTRNKGVKKSRFTWSHHGTKPSYGSTYIVNERNHKDEILIRHLLVDQPWKARHGHVKAAWDSLLDNLLTEKREGVCVFDGASVVTLRKRYEQVYLHLGKTWTQEKEKRNQEEASEDEEPETDNQRTTKQLIKQGILDLYEEFLQHEEQLESEKQEEKQQDAHGKMAAICIREAALGQLRGNSRKTSYKEQSTSSSSSVCNKARADVATDATTLAADNTSGGSNNELDDDGAHESPLIRMKRGPSPTSLPSSTKKQQSLSDVDSIVKDVVKSSSSRQERMLGLQEKKWTTKRNAKNVNGWRKRIAKRRWI